jgi:dTMP kinase
MNESGKLIVIEGLDGSGKTTQTELLSENLSRRGLRIRRVKFPDYESDSSAPVRMYLNGELGELGGVNLYAASSFYACDRYISFRNAWGKDYSDGAVILCDRYVTSNLAYQMPKLPADEWSSYMDWLFDFEYAKLGLPEPDLVLYLDMLPSTSRNLLAERYSGDMEKLDLHEKDLAYLERCREAALYAADKLGWAMIRCCNGERPLPAEAIAGAILAAVEKALGL